MRLANIDEFCTKLNIPESLQKKLEESLKYSADKLAYLWLSSEEDIYGDLNINLKFEFLKAIHEDLITNCHFFKGKRSGFCDQNSSMHETNLLQSRRNYLEQR